MFASRAINFFIYAYIHPPFKAVFGYIIRCSYEDIPNPSKLLRYLLKKDELCVCCYNMSVLCSYCCACRKPNCSICCRTYRRQNELVTTYKNQISPDGPIVNISSVENGGLEHTNDGDYFDVESVKESVRSDFPPQPKSIDTSTVKSAKKSARFKNSPQPGIVDNSKAESAKESVRFENSTQPGSVDNSEMESAIESARFINSPQPGSVDNSEMESSKESVRFGNSPQPGSVDNSNVESAKESVRIEFPPRPESIANASVESVKENVRVEYYLQPESINLYRRIGSGSRFVQIQILNSEDHIKGCQDTRAVVVFRCKDETCLCANKVIKEAGGDVGAEYQAAKAKGGKYVRKGVILTKAGKYPGYIIHCTVASSLVKFRDALVTALQVAEKHELKSIVFTSYVLTRIDIHQFLQIVGDFSKLYRPICLNFVQLFLTSREFNKLRQLRQCGILKSCSTSTQLYTYIV